MQKKAASQSMIGDMNRYQQVAMADSMAKGNNAGSDMAANMAGMQMGMMMGQQMMNNMANAMNTMNGYNAPNNNQGAGNGPKFCPNCGTPATGSNFCGNCGYKLM